VLEALESTGRFRCVREGYSFWPGIAGFFRHYAAGALPGVHQLTGFSQLVVAARRLSDNLASSAGLLAERDEQARPMPRVEYSPGNISGYPVLRLLYPDATYIHIVRDPRFLIARSGTASLSSTVRLGRRWRSEQRLLLGTPPAPTLVQARFEDMVADPIVWARSLGAICGAKLTDAELQRFAAVLRSRIAASGDAHGRGWSGPATGFVKRVLSWALAISCDAELAALGYQDSIGRPGVCRRLAAAAILGSWAAACGKDTP
jgi:hypothetical protein